MKKLLLSTAAISVIAAAAVCGGSALADPDLDGDHGHDRHTATPIKHLVVIFQENRSFDHYFATYPNATNPPGEIPFKASGKTPSVNNLANANLLTNNPNLNPANGAGATNPFRLDRTQANTESQNHSYMPEQEAYDNGKADLFPKFTGRGTPGGVGAFGTTGQVMGYFDGNTVMAMWNYAQYFALSDNAYTDTYGPSSPGALEVVSGQTNGGVMAKGTSGNLVADGEGGFTLIGDIDPASDVCSSTTTQVQMTSKNIGDLLDAADISWGGFMGGFNLQTINANGSTGCTRSTFSSVVGSTINDYVPHHAWLQYFVSTGNPSHLRPSSVSAIGHSTEGDSKTVDPANHEYDLQDFFTAVKAGNFPAVSYIKMAAYQDGHPGNSDPLDEQQGVVDLVNFLELQPDWKDTAVIITYDDSDGWYDHAYAVPTSASYSTSDAVNGTDQCGTGVATQPQPDGLAGKPVNGRCGPGTRIPFLVISPFAKRNFVSHTRISQASVVRFIEDNWLRGERLGGGSFDATAGSIMDMFDFDRGNTTDSLFLDPETGIVISPAPPNRH